MHRPLSIEQRKALRHRARAQLWRRGDLSWLVAPSASSLQVYQAFHAAPPLSMFVEECSRKVGKSFLGLALGFEACLANPGKRVNYATRTGKEAEQVLAPLAAQMTKDAPPELRPVVLSDGTIAFPKYGPAEGAHIVLFGAENQAMAERGRGPESVLNIVDEAGFIPVLRYLLIEVLKPQLVYTKGKTLVLSSPPISQGHEFCVIADAAKARGLYSHRNVYTPGGLFESEQEIEEYVASFAADLGITVSAFRKSAAFKREVLGQRCMDETLAVVPEFAEVELDSHEKHPVTGQDVLLRGIVRPHPRPAGWMHVDKYASLDPGMSDLSGGLFAYNDFLAGGLVVVEDELLMAQARTAVLAAAFAAKEKALGYEKMRLRVVDDPGQRLVADFENEHKQSWSPARKDDREAAINLLRVIVGNRQLIILPNCVNFIRHLRHAVRVRPGGDMARSESDGHFDLVAAAWYLTRHVERDRNPYPKDFGEPLGLPNMHRVSTLGPPTPSPLAQALAGGTPLGRRLLRGGRGKR